MENHNEPDAIREKLAEIAGNCIERRIERRALALLVAAKVRDYGDTAARNGNLIDAARYHQRALALMGEAASAALEALEICRDFGIEPPDELTGAGWALPTEHRGVGEGDAGLPDSEPAPCGCEKSPAEPEPEPEPEYIDPADRDPRPPVYCR